MAEQTDVAAATEPKNRFQTVPLTSPIARGETQIETLTLRKPKAGELRNLNLQDILQTDVTAMLKLIPRISDPPLTEVEADNLEAEDLAEIGGVIRGFFMTQLEKAAMEAMLAEHRPKT